MSLPRTATLVIIGSLILAAIIIPNRAEAAVPSLPASPQLVIPTTEGAAPRVIPSDTSARAAATMWSPCGLSGTSPTTIYLPNVTKTLGGPNGWVTPFYIQNTGTGMADISVVFYRFSDGAFVTCRTARGVSPAEVITDNPNDDPDLPDNTQFAVVITSFGMPAVATVNQVQGSGATTQALSYSGFSSGSMKVYLPNVTRRFYGYDVPFIVQNMGTATASVTASFVSFDGTQHFSTGLAIAPGRSGVIDPDYTPGLVDGTQYAVTLNSSQPIGVVVNAHNEALGPVAFSHNGLASGGTTLYAPYASKSAPDGSFSPIVVQNIGTAVVDATLSFVKMNDGGSPQTFTLPAIPAGGARAFDPRFALGTVTPCTTASSTCLAAGEYSLKITATGPVTAVVLPNSSTIAGAYLAQPSPQTFSYLPIVMKNVGGVSGWNSTLYLQSAGATWALVRFYRIPDYTIEATAWLSVTVNGVPITRRFVPADFANLRADGLYSVVVEGQGGPLIAVVSEHADTGGDASMFYEGFGVAPATGGSINGQVTNASNGLGVGFAIVSAIDGTAIVNRTSADVNGNYSLPLPQGSYYVRVDVPSGTPGDLVRQYSNGAYNETEATTVNVGPLPTTVNVALRSGVRVSGRATGTSGEAVPNASVFAWRTSCGASCGSILGAVTDVNGNYTLLVPTGTYRFHFVPKQATPYLDTWWPASESFAMGADLPVSASIGNVNAVLPRGYLLQGTVRDTTGRPIPGIVARVRLGGSSPCCTTEAVALTDIYGRYTAVVPAGTYRVSFIADAYMGFGTTWYQGTTFVSSANVVVDSTDVGGVDATLGRGVWFSGWVTVNGQPANATVQVYLGSGSTCCGNLVYSGSTGDGGSFSVGLPPGTYRIRFVVNIGGVYTEKWLNGGTTWSSAPDVTLSTQSLVVTMPFP